MSILEDKERLIDEIQKLRALISKISCVPVEGSGNLGFKVDEDKKEEAQKKVNDIHNIIFNM